MPSASLVSDDPTLLFTVAGMVPFIPYLTGLVPAPYPRATSVQKCIRTLDIEEVGKTTRHGTFFQMNGNFSFGDYFKEQAHRLRLGAAHRPRATAASASTRRTSGSRSTRTTTTPSSSGRRRRPAGGAHPAPRHGHELLVDRPARPGRPVLGDLLRPRPRLRRGRRPGADEDRYVEIWNLVFMQYLRGDGRGKNDFEILGDLPKKNIDTGMGLERVAFIKQGVENMYEIDQVRPVLDLAPSLSGRQYGADHEDDVRMRVVADHVRSSLMLMADGVTPVQRGTRLHPAPPAAPQRPRDAPAGCRRADVPELFPASRDAMKAAYPEVGTDFARIGRLAYAEEETFRGTLASGTRSSTLRWDQDEGRRATRPGDTAFLLHDTFGFPIDLTLEIAEEAGLSVDREAFDSLMAQQRERAKADARAKKHQLADLSVYSAFRAKGETVFTGYDFLTTDTTVLGLIVDGQPSPSPTRATWQRSSSPKRRCTRNPAGKKPTPGRLSATDSNSTCSTCSARSRGS